MMRTGPNDARHVVWAISKFFFPFLIHFFNTEYYIKVICYSKETERQQQQQQQQQLHITRQSVTTKPPPTTR